MDILPLEGGDLERARSFLLPYERFCIPLSAKLRAAALPAYAALDGGGAICGLFTFSRAGQLFHCLPLRKDSPRSALLEAFTRWFGAQVWQEHAFFSFNGEAHGTDLLLQALQAAGGPKPTRIQRYDFMRSAGRQSAGTGGKPAGSPLSGTARPLKPLADGCKIIRCTPSLADTLFPLQTAYEKEEVVFNLDSYSEDVSLLALKKALREQAVYALFREGAPVAKGGTNAQGERYVQLGGVYTVPGLRGRGYARALVQRITADFARQGKRTALFVKPGNLPAQRLYASCGFEKYGIYETAYF